MKKIIIFLILLAMPIVAQAQTWITIGKADTTGTVLDRPMDHYRGCKVVGRGGYLDTLYAILNKGTASSRTIEMALYRYQHAADSTFVDSITPYAVTGAAGNYMIRRPVIGRHLLTLGATYVLHVIVSNDAGDTWVKRIEMTGVDSVFTDNCTWPPWGATMQGSGGSIGGNFTYTAGAVLDSSGAGSPVDLTAFTWTYSDTSTAGRLQTSATFSNTCDSLVYWAGTDTTATNRSTFTRKSVAATPTSAHSENTTGLSSSTWYQIDCLAYSGGALRDSMEVHGKTKWAAPDAKLTPVYK